MLDHKLITKQIKTALIFILSIGAFYTLFWLIIQAIDLYLLKKATAITANALLQLFAVPSVLDFGLEPSIIIGKVTAQITNLCAGDLEIALITAIILATWDRTIRNRIIGILIAWLLILILNPIRIFIVLLIGYYSSWQWANFTHDVLFRLTLLAVIVFYYFIWYVKYDWVKKKVKKWKKDSHYLRR